MADWRQIQARIRKAKAAPEPAGQLSELFERTRDGMVAFELAKWHEKAGATPDAVQWYTTAAERFRRPQWRTKAEEALTRLGAPLPAYSAAPAAAASEASEGAATLPFGEAGSQAAGGEESPSALSALESEESSAVNTAPEAGATPQPTETGQAAEIAKRRRHRGRRGGRGRRRGPKEPASAAAPRAAASAPAQPVRRMPERPARPAVPVTPERAPSLEAAPASIGWPAPEGGQMRGRAGDPGLSSRMAHLESQLRRLLASALYKMEDADQAPAGPGVFLVTDTEQTSYYHVESCQTLRIGIANQLRADRRAPKGTETLRTKFADHLGITESQVAKYLDKHCAVRWLQLDEGAGALAHFAIAVLKPVLDE